MSGKTQSIKIGLNEDLAIAALQASLLEGPMFKERLIVVTTFLTTLLLELITSLPSISLYEVVLVF